MTTTVTLKNQDGTFTVELNEDLLTAGEIVDQLVRPVLLAAGFHPSTVEEVLDGG